MLGYGMPLDDLLVTLEDEKGQNIKRGENELSTHIDEWTNENTRLKRNPSNFEMAGNNLPRSGRVTSSEKHDFLYKRILRSDESPDFLYKRILKRRSGYLNHKLKSLRGTPIPHSPSILSQYLPEGQVWHHPTVTIRPPSSRPSHYLSGDLVRHDVLQPGGNLLRFRW